MLQSVQCAKKIINLTYNLSLAMGKLVLLAIVNMRRSLFEIFFDCITGIDCGPMVETLGGSKYGFS